MLVFALLYGVRPSSNGPHFAELEDGRGNGRWTLICSWQRLPCPRPTRPASSRGQGCPALPPTQRVPGHPHSNPAGQGLEREQLEPLSFPSLLRNVLLPRSNDLQAKECRITQGCQDTPGVPAVPGDFSREKWNCHIIGESALKACAMMILAW